MKRKLSSLLLMATIAIALFSCSQEKPIDTAKLEGYWVLNVMDTKEAKTLFEGPLPSIQFNFTDSMVAGSGGCNRYSGKFELNAKNEFKAPMLITTQMMCMHKNEETSFLNLLSQDGLKISISEDDQTIYFKRGENVVLEFIRGEEPAKGPLKSEVVTADNVIGKWQLKAMKDQDLATLFGESKPTLEFLGEENKVGGKAGCNGYRGVAEFGENGAIKFGPLMSTKMACPFLDGEQKYLKALESPLQATIDDDILVFRQDNVTVLEFEKIAAE